MPGAFPLQQIQESTPIGQNTTP
uniref:Uncharacterized protein n=1 Tax=Rhizophora mucronata TaxID=61149 RepID=A0A2P2QMY7_RHIMU